MGDDVERWLRSIPVITRVYVIALCAMSVATTVGIVAPIDICFLLPSILRGQVWRLVTCFIFHGKLSIHFFFHLRFLYVYSRKLEENHYHNRAAEYLWLLLVAAALLIAVAWAFPAVVFLSEPFVLTIVYIWSRRNPDEHLRILAILPPFSAPYLPLVILLLDLFLGGSLRNDILGIVVGHVLWNAADLFPRITGHHLLLPPRFLSRLLGDAGAAMDNVEIADVLAAAADNDEPLDD